MNMNTVVKEEKKYQVLKYLGVSTLSNIFNGVMANHERCSPSVHHRFDIKSDNMHISAHMDIQNLSYHEMDGQRQWAHHPTYR